MRGSVVEVAFADELPAINEALRLSAGERTITLEVAHHLDPRTVRAIAMDPTEGLARGMAVARTGQPITVPVGPATLGRLFNVLGEPLDGASRWPEQSAGRFTVPPPRSLPSSAASSSWKPGSRSSISWLRCLAAARRA